MRNPNTFGVHFTLGKNRAVEGKCPIYARIAVNGKRSEIGLKQYLYSKDWNEAKGAAKPKNVDLKTINTYLESVRAKLNNHYRNLEKDDSVEFRLAVFQVVACFRCNQQRIV